jgi:hypothetical protein
MPYDALVNPDNFRVQGSLTVIADPNGNSGNVNIGGTLTASGTVTLGSNLTINNNEVVSGSVQAQSGIVVTGGLNPDFIIGGPAAASTTSQSFVSGGSAGAAGSYTTVTMTGSGNVIFVNVSGNAGTYVMTPTSSSVATTTAFTNGMEVTLINVSPSSSSTLVFPSASAGGNNNVPVTISGLGAGMKFKYVTALSSWIHVA